MRRRGGYTLTEMLVVITTLSVMGTLGATTIFLMMRAEGSGARRLAAGTNYTRLAHDFRRDVHAARTAETDDNAQAGARLVLRHNAGRQIVYRAEADAVVRTVQAAGERVAGDTYRLVAGEIRFEIAADSEPVFARLVHRRHRGQRPTSARKQAPGREFRIEAVLGRDRRFVAEAE